MKVAHLQIIIVRHNHIRNILYIVHNAALPLFMANTHTQDSCVLRTQKHPLYHGCIIGHDALGIY